MSFFIIIRGPLGVGKTTIAKKLAKILNAKYISIDLVLEKNDLDLVEGEKCIPAKNFIKANEIILPKIKEGLNQEKIIILDGCFYHQEQIRNLIQNLSAPYYIFTLKAPLEVCIKRDSRRKKKHGKEATKAVHHLVSEFDYGTAIDINNKALNQVVKKILSHLPKPKI